jgi:hypothetical protein
MTTVTIARTGQIPQTRTSLGNCKRKCPGGYKCTCDDREHTLHICQHPDCWCHSQERYVRGWRKYEDSDR